MRAGVYVCVSLNWEGGGGQCGYKTYTHAYMCMNKCAWPRIDLCTTKAYVWECVVFGVWGIKQMFVLICLYDVLTYMYYRVFLTTFHILSNSY